MRHASLGVRINELIPDATNSVSPNTNVNALDDFGRSQVAAADSVFGETSQAIVDTSNQANRVEQANEARGFANRASANLRGQLERRQRGLGLNLSGRQQRSQTRRLGLTRSIAQANAVTGANRISAGLAEDANRAGAGLQDSLQGLESFGLTQLAGAEGARNQRLARERAAKRASRNSLIGSAVGTGLSLLALSSEYAKDRVEESPQGLLDKLSTIRIDKWRYKGEDIDHVGPYAEEFNDVFEVGKGHRDMISLVDAVGVTMAAVKELNAKVEARVR